MSERTFRLRGRANVKGDRPAGLTARITAGNQVLDRIAVGVDGDFNLNGPWPSAAPVGSIQALLELVDRSGHRRAGPIHLELCAGANQFVELSMEGDRRMRWVGGEPLNAALAARLSEAELRQAYGHLRRPTRPANDLDSLRAAFPAATWDRRSPSPLDEWGFCGRGQGDSLRALLAERGAPLGETDAELPQEGAVLRRHLTRGVAVLYCTGSGEGGEDEVDPALPAAREPLSWGDGTRAGIISRERGDQHPENMELAPRYVQMVAAYAQSALDRLEAAPYSLRDPRPHGGRLEIRILQQGFFRCSSHREWVHLELSPNLSDQAARRWLVHGIAHRIAGRYPRAQGPLADILEEGAADLLSELLEGQSFRGPIQFDSLWSESNGPRSCDRQASRWFLRTLGERAGDPVAFLRAFWEGGDDSDASGGLQALRSAVQNGERFADFDRFLQRGEGSASKETRWGDFWVCEALRRAGIESSDARFTHPAGPQSPAALGADSPKLGRRGILSRKLVDMSPWSGRIFCVLLDGVRAVKFNYRAAGNPIFQVLVIGPNNELLDVLRSDKTNLSHVVPVRGATKLLLAIASREQAVDADLTLSEGEAAAAVMITPANCIAGTTLEVDPRKHAWTWLSPDVMVDNDGDGLADSLNPPGKDNRLRIRLRNRGNHRAVDLSLRLRCQPAAPVPDEGAWVPVCDAFGQPQELTGIEVEAHGEVWVTAKWAPEPGGQATQADSWFVRVELRAKADAPSTEPETTAFAAVSSVPSSAGSARGAEGNIGSTQPALAMSAVLEPGSPARTGVAPNPPLFKPNEQTFGPPVTAQLPRRRVVDDPNVLHLIVRRAGARRKTELVMSTPGSSVGLAPSPLMNDPSIDVERIELRRSAQARKIPVDVRSLPPGMNPENLVTATQLEDGRAVGGVSFLLGV